MKIAISGKGGVGKTTFCALLAQETARQSYRVLAIDADPNPTLAATLGFAHDPPPLLELRELMEERLGSLEGFFRLNPRVDDIPDRFAIEKDGIKLLVMGLVRQGGEGCACPQNVILKSLLQHVVLERDELVLLDLEAGLEPLGRATAQGVDAVLIVIEPDAPSLTTSRRVRKLAQDIGLNQIFAVANKIREPGDLEYIGKNMPKEIELLGALPYSEAIRRAGRDRTTTTLADEDLQISREIQAILKRLESSLESSTVESQKGRRDGANLL
jgi:CO dehydrogenase maturation factor